MTISASITIIGTRCSVIPPRGAYAVRFQAKWKKVESVRQATASQGYDFRGRPPGRAPMPIAKPTSAHINECPNSRTISMPKV